MKKLNFISLFILLFCAVNIFSQTGITTKSEKINYVPAGKAETYTKPAAISVTGVNSQNPKIMTDTEWLLLDSLFLDSFIPANGNLGVKINTGNPRKLDVISPFNLGAEAVAAVRKAPKWLRPKLENTLSKLDAKSQKTFSDIINNAVDPYIDEIAYTVAYETPEFLASGLCEPSYLLDNAKLIYAHDSDLSYVDIVDYGDSKTDENYYSTVKYWKIDKDSNRVQIEVPKEIYYMYIVHPKLSDEFETYVDPTLIEYSAGDDSHMANLSEPPNGVFWRDYLYTHTEKKPDTTGNNYLILRDEVKKCNVLWDEKNAEPQAVRAVSGWINNIMNFDSGLERPHQPVRIYQLHTGRCGEHEDITNAAARACLIPSRGIDAYSSDHVWNEFWDEQWWQWEPVNNSYKNFLCYEQGWGKKFGSITMRRSDGVTVSATDVYSIHPCTINIYAYDVNNQPIDGAIVYLYVKGTMDETNIYIDNYAISDNDGKASFIASSGRSYYGKIKTSLGDYPTTSGQVAPLIDNPDTNKTYEYILKAAKAKTVKNPTVNSYPVIDNDEYLLRVNLKIESQAVNWQVLFNDFPGSYTTYETPGGKATFFIADEGNFSLCQANSDFSVVESKTVSDVYIAEYKFKRWQNYDAWLKNINCMSNYVHASGSFSLYCTTALPVEEANNNYLIKISPNPATDYLDISLPAELSQGKIDIYSVEGIKIMETEAVSRVDVSSLCPGVYFVKVGGRVEKFVKM